MAKTKLTDYIEKKREWVLVQCKIEKKLGTEFKKELKADGISITSFFEGAIRKYRDEKKEPRK